MRRNLTLEDAGVLDLRKFQSPEAPYFTIPFDWLLLHGIVPVNLANSAEVAKFLKSKFNLFIVAGGMEYNDAEYASTSLNQGEDTAEIATLVSGDYIYVDAIDSEGAVVELAI